MGKWRGEFANDFSHFSFGWLPSREVLLAPLSLRNPPRGLVSEKRKQKASLERSRVIKRALIEMKSDLKRPAGIRKSAKNRETACRNNGTIKN